MQSTRQEILEILKEAKQATVDDLAERLDLTPMTIRHHLNVLQAQNLVAAVKVRRSQRVGRPSLVYTLTDAADDLFPQSYGELAGYLVSQVKKTVGPAGTEAILHGVAERIAQEAPPALPGQTFEQRLEQVVAYLERRGFQLRWEKTDGGYALANVNCPYRRVAQEHAEVCTMDAILLDRLLGVEVRGLSRQDEGEAACRWLLVPASDN